MPHRHSVEDAIHRGTAAAFLEAWGRDLAPSDKRGAILSRLPAAASYDAYFAPGTGAAKSHHARAAAYGYSIDEEALAIVYRRQLLEAILTVAPSDHATSILDWRRALEPGSDVARIREDALDRMAAGTSRTPSHEENTALRAHGYRFCDQSTARASRYFMILPMIRMEKIEGFDPNDLPESPILALFRSLDPSLVRDLRVNPVSEAEHIKQSIANNLAKGFDFDVPNPYHEAAAKVGYLIEIDRPEPDVTAPDLEMPCP